MFKYLIHSGKNSKLKYYAKNSLMVYFIPNIIFRIRRRTIIEYLKSREDKEYITDRVNYYCRLSRTTVIGEDSSKLSKFHLNGGYNSVYFFDTFEYLRYFPKMLYWKYKFGDVITIPDEPSIVKSRPVCDNNQNSVLMKLDKVRHFIFFKDRLGFKEKEDKAIFRGKIYNKPRRIDFGEKWFGDPMCDVGEIKGHHYAKKEWLVPKMTLYDHMKYKFVICLEGNDVASNLKWVMNSNSLAIMPHPSCETWFMEGKLLPNYHYVEIKPDYSDLKERMQYYIGHPDEAEAIINHAHEWCEQFKDSKREKLISILVLYKYFEMTGQYI